jgi:hypothetical protein
LQRSGLQNLVTADGGVEVDDDFDKQEYLNSKLIFYEALIGLTLVAGRVDNGPVSGGLQLGGSFVLKVFDTVSKISADTIFILTRCFERVSIIKPVTSRPSNSERYVICQDKHPDEETKPWIDLMMQVGGRYDAGINVTGFIPYLNGGFTDRLINHNNISMESQIKSGQMILDLDKGIDIAMSKVDLMKCFTVWNLPSPDIDKVCKVYQPRDISSRIDASPAAPSRLNKNRGRGRGRGRR